MVDERRDEEEHPSKAEEPSDNDSLERQTEEEQREVEGPDEDSATDDLAQAFGHLRAAAEKLVDRATEEGARSMEVAKETAMPLLRDAGKMTEELASKVDPAARAAGREAEKVVEKFSATAEPLARQLSDGLQKLGARLGAGFKKRPPPPESED